MVLNLRRVGILVKHNKDYKFNVGVLGFDLKLAEAFEVSANSLTYASAPTFQSIKDLTEFIGDFLVYYKSTFSYEELVSKVGDYTSYKGDNYSGLAFITLMKDFSLQVSFIGDESITIDTPDDRAIVDIKDLISYVRYSLDADNQIIPILLVEDFNSLSQENQDSLNELVKEETIFIVVEDI